MAQSTFCAHHTQKNIHTHTFEAEYLIQMFIFWSHMARFRTSAYNILELCMIYLNDMSMDRTRVDTKTSLHRSSLTWELKLHYLEFSHNKFRDDERQ